MHAFEPGRVDEHLELRARGGKIGHRSGVELEYQVWHRLRRLRSDSKIIRPDSRLDQAKVSPENPVLVQTGDVVEFAGDLLDQRLAPLGFAIAPVRIESGLEQPDQPSGDD